MAMGYDMVRLGFSTTDSWLSGVIRYLTASEVSHTFFQFDLFGQDWVLEADVTGVRIIPWSRFIAHNRVVFIY
jgi:hypothetical protein